MPPFLFSGDSPQRRECRGGHRRGSRPTIGGVTREFRLAGDGPSASLHGAGATVVVLGHGAGGNRRNAMLRSMAEALAASGRAALLYNFPYSEAGSRRPDAPAVLEATTRAAGALALEATRASRIVHGGRSMGGRIASQVLASPAPPDVHGLVLLGYPLHPPGQPEKLRAAHLPALHAPTLVVQGARDEFGDEGEVRTAFAAVPAPVAWHVVAGGDHSFKVRRREGPGQAEVLAALYDAVAAWVLARHRP